MKKYIYAANDPVAVRVQTAKDPNTSPEVLDQLANDRSNKVKLAVAKNPNTSDTTLAILCDEFRHSYEDAILAALGTNPNTPIDSVLSLFGNRFVCWKIANSKPTNPIILRALVMQRRDYEVWDIVAKNPNTPSRTLRYLYKHSWCSEELAKNPNTPKDILEEILKEGSRHLQNLVLKNPAMKGKKREDYLNMAHNTPFDQYVGQDIWLLAYTMGISRDYECYVRLLSKKRKSSLKDEYTYNMVESGASYSSDAMATLEEMSAIFTGTISYGDSEECDVYISTSLQTYSTIDVLDKI